MIRNRINLVENPMHCDTFQNSLSEKVDYLEKMLFEKNKYLDKIKYMFIFMYLCGFFTGLMILFLRTL